ncbi:MAG: BrnA antitoxin family protein [Betaproteobacteria bacterium]|nr:BrnA antitoxin family protein [Betaproteobacteria bacterium]
MAVALAAAPDEPVADADNPPTVAAQWQDAVESRSLPELRRKLVARRRGPGRAPLKVPTTIRFDADVLAALKASGKGWQTRVNEAMRDWLKTHSPG